MSLRTFAIGLLLTWLLAPSSAWAHAELLSASPAANQSLEVSPEVAVLRFNEPVEPVYVRLIDKDGQAVAGTSVTGSGAELRLAISAPLIRGSYILTYRVISADTHPVGGSYVFSVGVPAPVAVPMPGIVPASSGALVVAVRGVLYAALLLAAGSALFIGILNPPAAVAGNAIAAGRLAAIIAAMASVLICGVAGADQLGASSVIALMSRDPWIQGFKSTLGESAVLAVAGTLVLLWSFRGSVKRSRAVLLSGAGLGLVSFCVTGHAATAPPVALSTVAVLLHVVTAAFWGGALWPLLRATSRLSGEETRALMEKFSRVAVFMVALLVISGLLLTYIQVKPLPALLHTTYGIRLVAKLCLVVILMGLAAINRFVMTKRLSFVSTAGAKMQTVIGAELALFLTISLVAASLTTTPPPRALVAEGANGHKTIVLEEAPYKAQLDITPGQAGANMFMVRVQDGQGAAVPFSGMMLTLSLPSGGVAPFDIAGHQMVDDVWHFDVSETVVAGDWQVGISAYLDGFTKIDFSGHVRLDRN